MSAGSHPSPEVVVVVTVALVLGGGGAGVDFVWWHGTVRGRVRGRAGGGGKVMIGTPIAALPVRHSYMQQARQGTHGQHEPRANHHLVG